MGIIKRQSLKFTIINLIGTFIGFLSVIFIYPLDKELYGYFQSLYSNAYLLTPILGLGIQAAVIKYFPLFKQKNQDHNFFGFTFSIVLITLSLSSAVLAIVYIMFKPYLFEVFNNFQFISDNILTIYFLGILLLLSSFFIAHATVRMRIVIPDLLYSLLLKIFLPLVILLTFLNFWPREWFTSTILIYFVIIALVIFAYILWLKVPVKRPQLKTLNTAEYYGFAGFMGFSFLNGLGSSVALKLDISMISTMISIEAVQVYAIIMTISNIMDIPARALNQIASPVISSSWNTGDRENIQMVYQKSSVYGFFIGLLMFLVLFFCWTDILDLMPNKPASLDVVLSVFLFLSLARISDLMTGVNSVIITYSEKFKYHMYFLVVLAIVNVILNYIFISRYNIIGAALATGISYFMFNLGKYIFVKRVFSFSINWWDHSKIMCSAIVIYLVMDFISFSGNPVVNIGLKSLLVSALLGFALLWINPFGEVRHMVQTIWTQTLSLLKK